MTSPAKCPSCNGSGVWINPHDALDGRRCRKCNGTGLRKRERRMSNLGFVPDKATTRGEAPTKSFANPRDDAYWDKLAENFGEWP